MKIESEKLKQYLLGNLTENETEAIDLFVITENSSEETLLLAENNLMEDYLDGLLSPSERELFQKNFINQVRIEQLRQLAMLREYAQKQENTVLLPGKKSSALADFFNKLIVFLRQGFRPLLIASAVILIFLGWMAFYFYNRPADELAELNRRDLSDLTEFQNLPQLNLIPGTFRAPDETNKLRAGNLSESILLRLALPSGGDAYNVKIMRDQREILRLDSVRSYRNQAGAELRLVIPADRLEKGNYQIQAVSVASPQNPLTYTFSLQ